jgi:hypothetical protein
LRINLVMGSMILA